MTEVEKYFRKALVEENRKRKESNDMSTLFDMTIDFEDNIQELSHTSSSLNIFELSTSTGDSDVNLDFSAIDISQNSDSQIIDPVLYCYDYEETVISPEDIEEIEEFLNFNEFFQNSVDIYKPTLEFVSQNLPIPRPVTDYENNFTEVEDYKLMELFEVLRPLDFELTIQSYFFEIGTVGQLVQIANTFYEKEIISFVNSVKKMNVFQNICENDRITLVKYGCMDIMMLRSVQLYDLGREAYKIPIVSGIL